MIGIRRNQLFVILTTILFLFNSQLLFGQECSASAVNEAGDVITFNGVTYDETPNGCTSTWSYCLTAGPGNPEISHFMIANNSCLGCFDSASDIIDSSHPVEMGTDPTTGQCGIKFDFGLSVNEEVCFSFTLKGAFEVAERLFVTKAANKVRTIAICGPKCSETICETTENPPPPEVEDPPTPEVDCPTIAYNDAGDEITFMGVTYNANGEECTSTWSYCLKAGPGNPEISHFNIASPNCLACLDSEDDILNSSHPFEIGTDPTTGQCGIKFDFGLNVNEEICFNFTLKGSFAVAEQLFVTKAGQNVHTVAICGPECTEVTCETEEQTEELDCIDVVANRPVETINDNCGTWCDTYVFTLGPGNCYDAGDDLYFTEYNNGTATLKGSVLQGTSIGYLDILFTGRTSSAPTGSPKYMLCINDGGEFWYYYPEFTGTFTYPNGEITNITRRGPAFQVGYGANVQDYEYGASGWFDTDDGGKGDFNFQLGNTEICEETEIFLEVECAEVGSLFETFQDEDASNGDYVSVQSNNNAYNNAPESAESRIRFNVDLTSEASFFIFARVKTPSTYDDSFWVRVNNGSWVKWNEIPQSNTFTWAQVHDNTNNNTPVSFFFSAGPNTIDFAYREDGTMLDKIYLGQSEVSPIGIGAEASNCICEEELVLTCTPTNEDCEGSNTPGINLEVTGATSSVSYLWSNGATTQNLSDLEPGTYSVTVTTLNNCTATCTTTVEENIPLSIECFATNANCTSSGGSLPTGLATVLTTGGTAPLSYQWSNGGTTNTIDGVEPGIYSVTVTDAKGCAQSCNVNVETEASFNLNCKVINDYCNGNTNGAIYLELDVDPSSLSYLWSNGSTENILAGVGPGTYSVTVTHNVSGCSKSCSATLDPYEPLSIECQATNTTCGSTDDGTVTVYVTGGTEPYTIHWENGNCTAFGDGLEAGEYPIMVTDANGCEANCTAIVEPSESLSVNCFPANGDCGGALGDITTQVVGGSGIGTYTYLWNTGAATPNLYNVASGTYSVTVTDENGCFGICETTFENQLALGISCIPTDANCGATDGKILTNVFGGTTPYTFAWSNGATTQDLTNITPGSYSLTVTDANGCFTTCESLIEENSAPEISCTSTNNTCGENNGLITTQVNGGKAPYTYIWNNGATSANLDNLSEGSFEVTVTDANGCQSSCGAIIEATQSITITCDAQSSNCEGTNTALISTSITGGNGPYSYLWSNGAITSQIENIASGIYSVTVTDINGCTASCEAEVVNYPTLELNCSYSDFTCGTPNLANLATQATGGDGNYTFAWSNGVNTQNQENVDAGIYTVTVTDGQGCSATCTVEIPETELLSAECIAQSNTCDENNSNSISVNLSGGTAPYTYLWSNGSTESNLQNVAAGTYGVTVTDALGCFASCTSTIEEVNPISAACQSTDVNCAGENTGSATVIVTGGKAPYTYTWSNGATTANIDNLLAGTYSVTVTDANDCFTTCETIIIENSNPEITCIASNTICGANNGAISTEVTAGVAPYSYSWNNGATSANLENLPEGNYTVTITDANGCQSSCSAIIEATQAMTVACNPQSGTCDSNSNSISVNITGGTAPYTYLWSNGSTESALQNVAAGNYNVLVTDALGCTATCEASIASFNPLTATCEANNLDCTSEETGLVNVTVAGGQAPYTYSWNNGATTASIGNLPIGTYEVTVTDGNGCTATCSATVEEAEPIIVISSSIPLECHGDSTSIADFTITGGTGPYTYIWDNGSTDPVIYNLSAGFYGITVTDANGCIGICGTWVEGPEAIETVFETTDVTCFGGNDGTIITTVSGGTGAYSFLWNNGSTSQNLSGLEAGVYMLTVSDENGCTQVFTTTIESNSSLEASCSPTPLSCPDANDANILVDVNGGTGNYTFIWSNGATSQNLLNVVAGTYTLTVTDENGCTTTCTSTIEAPTPLSLVCTTSDLLCAGPQTGAINTVVDGGTAPYTYQWDNGATTANLENLNTGTYNLTVTDANGCSIVCSSNVETSLPLSLSIEGQDLLCGEANSGIAAAIVEGGTAPYAYDWSNGSTSAQVNNLDAGTFDLTVTDVKGCTATASVTINAIPALSLVCESQDLLCGDTNSGNIETSISGGTAPFNYSWSNGATSESLVGVPEGSYTLTVTDANGCTAICTSTLIYIEPMTASCSASDLVCATPGTGSIDLNITGGTAPYLYIWSNNSNAQNLANLDAGIYTVTVLDANGCAAISSCEVGSALPLELSCNVVGATCGDDLSGDIDAEITGGTAPYSFLWSNGETTEDLTDILSGTYSLTVTDANGCTISCTSLVETSIGLNLSAVTEGIQCGEEGTGSVDLVVTGGTGNYTYTWSNGASTEDLFQVDAGSYSVTVMDNNGCSSVTTAIVEESTAMEAVCEPNNIPCGGEQTGSVDVTVINGQGPFGFEWSNGSIAEDLTSVGAGTYTVTITDANGCQTICSSTVTESPAFTLSCTSDEVNCKNGNDGAVSLTVSGGAEPFTYAWSNGATTQNLDNLSAGTYIVTATDANGCTATCTSVVTEPSFLIVVPQGNDISCNGQSDGSAFATVIGGTVPYTYAWSNGASTSFINGLGAGLYTLTVTDANGCVNFGTLSINEPELLSVSCNATPQDCQTLVGSIGTTIGGGTAPYSYSWSNGSTEAALTGALPGAYTVTVTDASGCTAICSANVAPANPINLTCLATNESCGTPSLGSIDLTVSGGTGPYFYQWSNGMATEDLSDVAAGTYSVTVTDVFGCSSVCSSIVEPAPSLGIQLISQDIACNGEASGSIQATVSQGMPPFSYSWNTGATSATIDGLSAGTYTVTVVDANGCASIANATLSQPSNILVVTSANPVTCHGGNNGTAFVTAIGGIPPYQYAWSNGMPTSFVNALSAGTYTVTVTDANGCSAVATTIVDEPAAIEINFTTTQLTCGSDIDGIINATVSGGVAPISYQWSTGSTSQTINELGAGTYGLIVTDANGCSTSGFVDIAAANPIELTCTATDATCAGEADGSAAVSVSGGALPYSYQWSNGATSTGLNELVAGTYTVTVTDANGCTAICTSIVDEPLPLIAEYGSSDVSCHGGNDGTLYAYPTGGTAPYNYEWSTGDNTETVENLPAGAYGLTLTDANGCIFICGIIISEPEAITCTTEVNPAISGTTDLYDVLVTASGGTGNLQYSIDGGANFQSDYVFADLPAGTYPIVIQDENGCTSECEAVAGGGSGFTGDNNNDDSRMAISPNPAESETTMTYETKYEGLTYIEVKNLDGKVIHSEEVYAVEGENTLLIDVSRFAVGTYFLVVYGPKGITSEQFSVNR